MVFENFKNEKEGKKIYTLKKEGKKYLENFVKIKNEMKHNDCRCRYKYRLNNKRFIEKMVEINTQFEFEKQ